MADGFDGYVAWYSWAKTSLADDAIVCHAAATAAIHALAAGSDPEEAARAVAVDEVALRQTRASYGSHHRYVEWFAWARNLNLPDARCHEAARAALQSIAAGGSQKSAAEAATRLLLSPAVAGRPQGGPEKTTAPDLLVLGALPLRLPATISVLAHQFTGDALWSIVLGVASVTVPVFTPIYFPILPIFGLWRGVLALRGGRVAGGVIGLVVSALGCVVSLLASGLLNSVFHSRR